jgi:hypothetical protein
MEEQYLQEFVREIENAERLCEIFERDSRRFAQPMTNDSEVELK